MADELAQAVNSTASLARLGDNPTDWAELLADRTERTSTTLRVLDDTPYEVAADLLHAISLQVLSSPWHIGDLLLELQRLYSQDEYNQLVDPETMPGGQTAANIRSICRAVPEEARDPRVAFWNYVPLAPLFRSEVDSHRQIAAAIVDLAARGGWTRAQIGAAVADAKRGLANRHTGRVQRKLEAMAEQAKPLPPTVTRIVEARPRDLVPGSKDLQRIVEGALLSAVREDSRPEVQILVGDRELDTIARSVTLWLQTDAPDEYLEAIEQGRQAARDRTAAAAARDADQSGEG